MVLETITRRTLSREVLSSLRRYILSHGLKPGDRLPTERELAADLGVSRATVRDALKTLEGIGALVRQPRRGSLLQSVDFSLVAEASQFLMVRSADDLSELFVARRLLEVSILPLVAQNATAEQYQSMEEANRLMEAEIAANGIAIEGDAAFHRALLAAANNKFLAQFGVLVQRFFHYPRVRLLVEAQTAPRSVAEHRQIVAALRAGEISGAQCLMGTHLDVYTQRGVVQAHSLEAREENGHAPL